MIHRIALAIAAAALIAGCGGGSEPESKPSSEPRNFTIDELKAAFPSRAEVVDVSRVDYTCPDKNRCPAPEEGEEVGIHFVLLPAGESPTEIEEAASDTIFGNSISFSAWLHDNPADAKKRQGTSVAGIRKYDGTYDIKQEGEIKTGFTPSEKGEGSLEAIEIGAWKGQFVTRHGTMGVDDRSEERLMASGYVIQGRATVDVAVSVLAEGRSPDHAEKLARKALADYLKRLG